MADPSSVGSSFVLTSTDDDGSSVFTDNPWKMSVILCTGMSLNDLHYCILMSSLNAEANSECCDK